MSNLGLIPINLHLSGNTKVTAQYNKKKFQILTFVLILLVIKQ